MWFKDASKELASDLSQLLSQLIAEHATDVPNTPVCNVIRSCSTCCSN